MSKTKLFLVALLVLVALPQVSSAYKTTDQMAIKLDSESYLYLVSYEFGFLNRELRMPRGAVRGVTYPSHSPYVGYTMLDDDGKSMTAGTGYSIVVSDAEIMGDEFYLPAGKRAKFTLVTLVKLPKAVTNSMSETDLDISLAVTSLPFTLIKEDGTETKSSLNPSELASYITPELKVK